jgi:hypothetical protein
LRVIDWQEHTIDLAQTSRFVFILFRTAMTTPQFDVSSGDWEFGTIIESQEDVPAFVFGELIDNEPVAPTVLTDATNV